VLDLATEDTRKRASSTELIRLQRLHSNNNSSNSSNVTLLSKKPKYSYANKKPPDLSRFGLDKKSRISPDMEEFPSPRALIEGLSKPLGKAPVSDDFDMDSEFLEDLAKISYDYDNYNQTDNTETIGADKDDQAGQVKHCQTLDRSSATLSNDCSELDDNEAYDKGRSCFLHVFNLLTFFKGLDDIFKELDLPSSQERPLKKARVTKDMKIGAAEVSHDAKSYDIQIPLFTPGGFSPDVSSPISPHTKPLSIEPIIDDKLTTQCGGKDESGFEKVSGPRLTQTVSESKDIDGDTPISDILDFLGDCVTYVEFSEH
jgi:hypothetical protein